MKKLLKIGKDSSGERNMFARFIFQNDKYGKDNKSRHGEEEPMVQLLIAKDGGSANHVCYKYLSTLNDNAKKNEGMCLCGATGLSIDADVIKKAVDECIDAWEQRQADDEFKILEYKAIDMIEEFGAEPQHLMAVAKALATIMAYKADMKAATIALPAMLGQMSDSWIEALVEREEDGNLE